jgi:protein transport protein SEC24
MSDCGGKLLVIQSALPRAGEGALDEREDSTVLGTVKEKEFYQPQDSFYQVQATTCAERFISVDLFVCMNSYVDIATVSCLSTMTGGQVFLYPGTSEPTFITTHISIRLNHSIPCNQRCIFLGM